MVKYYVDVKGCGAWYGFCYLTNQCERKASSQISLTLTGMEVYPSKASEVQVVLEPGEDKLILLRRTHGKCSCKYRYKPLPLEMTTKELYALCDEKEGTQTLGVSQKLFCSLNGGCVIFANSSDD